MPLRRGKSKKVINANIHELLHNYKETGIIGTSHPKSMNRAQKQAVAITYDKAKEKQMSKKDSKVISEIILGNYWAKYGE